MISTKAFVSHEDINKLPLSLTISMTVKEWRELMELMPNPYPGWKVASLIASSITNVMASMQSTTSGDEVDQ